VDNLHRAVNPGNRGCLHKAVLLRGVLHKVRHKAVLLRGVLHKVRHKAVLLPVVLLYKRLQVA
jgi:hypothetical protein